jgi:hypothetical protein
MALLKIVKSATLKIYPGAPHGMCSTHKSQVNADLLAFARPEVRAPWYLSIGRNERANEPAGFGERRWQ